MENKIRIPTEMEKLGKNIENMELRINDYKERKEEQVRKRNKKQKEWWDKRKMIVEDTWGMMTWLTKYIDENKASWERRRQNKHREDEKDLNKWKEMDKDKMIEELKSEKCRNSSSLSKREGRRQQVRGSNRCVYAERYP